MTARRSRTRSVRGLQGSLILLAVLLVAVTVFPAAAYSTGDAGRGVTVSVADDPDALLAIETAASVRTGHVDRLVVVTNGLGRGATVTVSLTPEAASKGELVIDGARVGDTYSATLSHSEGFALDIDIPADSSDVGDDIVFDVTAETASARMSAPGRRVPIEDGST